MAHPLPSEYTFGKVVGRAVHAIADSAADEDHLPEARPAVGKVTFKPRTSIRKAVHDYSAFVIKGPVTAKLDEQGRVVDAEGRPGIWLVTGTYAVTFSLADGGQIPGFTIEVTDAHTDENPLDLVTAAPPQPGPGITLQTILVPPGGAPDETLVRDADGALIWMPVDEIGPPGPPGEDGHTPLLTWSGTALVVDGVTGPDLKGPKGDTGAPGAPGALADASTYIITGPGRPNVPATTGGIITGDEPIGAEYRSTDGAGVGAWVWMKRPDGWGGIGWVVTDGDTGWRRLEGTTEQIPAIYLRRSNAGLHIRWPRSQTSNAITDNTPITPALPGEWIPPRAEYGYPLVVAAASPSATASLIASTQMKLTIRGSSVPAWLSADIIATPELASWPTTLPGIPW